MPIISGGNIIEGALPRVGGVASSSAGGVGPFEGAGVPTDGTSGTQAGYAKKSATYHDTTNGNVYVNAGTLASPVWKLVTRAA